MCNDKYLQIAKSATKTLKTLCVEYSKGPGQRSLERDRLEIFKKEIIIFFNQKEIIIIEVLK